MPPSAERLKPLLFKDNEKHPQGLQGKKKIKLVIRLRKLGFHWTSKKPHIKQTTAELYFQKIQGKKI